MKVTIGGFDGMHVGHQALIQKADKIIIIEKGSNLTPGEDRCDYTHNECVFYDLNDIKHLSSEQFITILKSLNTTEVIVGEDFRFGKDRRGDIKTLQKHFNVHTVKEVKIDGIGVHSRIIRDFLKKGDIKNATKFLGHTYKIKGTHIKGQGIGSEKLYPTINIRLTKNYLIPKPGVYISITNSKKSLTFIGVRSTDGEFSIETHILESLPKNEDEIAIEFVEYLRENKKFDTLEKLKKAIEEDIKKAKNYSFPTIALN